MMDYDNGIGPIVHEIFAEGFRGFSIKSRHLFGKCGVLFSDAWDD
jgi:hypothetical protein